MNAKSIRIKDIAQLAGVSVGTVDRVLHNRGRVSEEALKKVLGVLDQIDYKPNLIARTLGANKTYRIAALMPNPEQDPYWASSKSGISQAEAEWLRYGVKVDSYFFNLYDKNSFKQVAEALSASKPDGILVAPIFYHETLPFFDLFKDNGIPVVLFNTNIPEARPLSFIGQDLYQSGKVGAELMRLAQCESSGILTVLHINEDLDNSVHLAEKEKGFREYFESRPHGFNIQTLNVDDASQPEGQRQISALLSNPELRGIFVSTSKGTFLAASFLEKFGRKGVTVIGYDMLQENIRYMKKGIVNFLINQNPRRQAFLGVNHLVGNLILKKDAPEKDLLPLEIISPENLDSYLKSENH
ncbi:MAG TPA: substrate-binding domain-containing protein [Chryseosolibacter sp.]|nr:substrate-binding domain-containing protein [Chryseosolibacter sp.]